MLKFENIIKNLNLEEKVSLVSSDRFGNRNIESYDIPTFAITRKMENNAMNVVLPKYQSLGQTWDEELVKNFGEQVSLNSIYHKQRVMIGAPTLTSGEDSFGCCQYLVGKLAAAYIKGIENGGSFSCLNKAPEKYDDNFLGSEIAFKEGTPSAYLSSGDASIDLLNSNYFKGLRISCVSSEEELIARIYEGNHLVITQNVDAFKCINDALEGYKKAVEQYSNKRMTLADLNTLEKEGKILNEEKLDEAIDYLLFMITSFVSTLQNEGEPFDTTILRKAAEDSIVLLENNNVLPLNNVVKVALIGEQTIKPIMNGSDIELSNNNTPLAYFNKHEINLVGHAYGYSDEVKKQEMLVSEAVGLAKKADVSVVYIGTESENTLPEKQLKLIETLKENDTKLIGVLSGKLDIDLSFVDMFDALVYVGFNTPESIEATVRILLGLINPSGRLTNRYAYGNDEFGYRYCVGYGLSYSKFNYSQFKLLHNGISMTVENLDDFAGGDVVTLYVSRIENNVESIKELKGFVKTKLSAKEYQRITLPFDDYTFASIKDGQLGVLGGVYTLYVCRGENEVLFKKEISLEPSLNQKNSYSFEVVERAESADSMIQDFVSKNHYYSENSRMSLRNKIILETTIYAYFLITLTVISLLVSELLIVGVALIAIISIIYFVVLRKTRKNEEKYDKTCSPHPINDMVNGLENFTVTSKSEFNPQKQVKEEVKHVESTVETVVEAQEIQLDEVEENIEEEIFYATCEFELKNDEVEYSHDVDFGVLCSNFYEFALQKGLIIEQSSIRTLISSILSSKLIFMRTARMDLLPKVVSVLNEFLGNDENIFDVKNLEGNSLIWKTVDGKAVHTEFVKALYQAKKYRKHVNLVTLNNVNVETMNEYFEEYFKYCLNPSVNNNVNFGTKERKELFILPNNLAFIVIPETYDFIENIPYKVAVNSASIEIQVRENELIKEDEVIVKRYPYSKFMATIEVEKQHFYLSEESWKRIDDFEETLSNDGKFRVDNKTVLQIESFVSALLACGADEAEAFDAALSTKIAPTVKSYKLHKTGKESDAIFKALERHFDLDLIPLTLRVLRKKD